MCGIVGMAGNITVDAERAMRMLLILDSVRGEDSTGVASVGKHSNEVIVAKSLGGPFDLFGTKKYDLAVPQRASRAIIGHNRYATSGGVSRATAHPFEFDTLVGVHNGTLTNKHVLADQAQYKVDSENLFHHIEEHGLDDAIRIIKGAWALVWWDKAALSINFLRNKERPLFYTVSDNKEMIFWASEEWMLEIALWRNNIKHGDIELFAEDTHHEVVVAHGGKLGMPQLRKIENKPAPEVVVYQNFQQQTGRDPYGNVSRTTSTTSHGKATNIVVPTQKKVDVRSRMEAGFMQARNQTFEAVTLVKEATGAEYVLCFCAEKPYYEIRLYQHSQLKKIGEIIGAEFEADVSGFVQTESNNVGFYKVSPHTIKITKVSEVENVEAEYQDHKGKYLTKKDWEKKYGTCNFCTAQIEAEDQLDGARMTDLGDSLCIACAKDPEFAGYVNLI